MMKVVRNMNRRGSWFGDLPVGTVFEDEYEHLWMKIPPNLVKDSSSTYSITKNVVSLRECDCGEMACLMEKSFVFPVNCTIVVEV